MAFTRLIQSKNTMHLPDKFRDEAEKDAVIRGLQAELSRAVGDDIASLRNRIAKAKSIKIKEKR